MRKTRRKGLSTTKEVFLRYLKLYFKKQIQTHHCSLTKDPTSNPFYRNNVFNLDFNRAAWLKNKEKPCSGPGRSLFSPLFTASGRLRMNNISHNFRHLVFIPDASGAGTAARNRHFKTRANIISMTPSLTTWEFCKYLQSVISFSAWRSAKALKHTLK